MTIKKIIAVILAASAVTLSAAEEETMELAPMFSNSVHDYYLELFKLNARERKERLHSLKTREDAEKYVAEVRKKIRSLFPLPAEKTPLNARETGVLDMGTYTIHKVIYESRPGLPVTALLYLPKTTKKVPCILFLCGHSNTGKASDTYQTVPRMFVMKGYAVLAVDPIGQGERTQFRNISGAPNGSSSEHNALGLQLSLIGDHFCGWRAWDAIRGLDYLLSRPEVDTNCVGVTGTSGGGTMTTYVNALDDRITMAAPGSYITTWVRNVENLAGFDAEQALPNVLEQGLEMADLLIAGAPHALQILAQKNDFFDARGSQEAFEDVRHIYRLLGVEDKVGIFIGPDSHGYSKAHRESACAFFNKQAKLSVSPMEPENIVFSSEKETFCTPAGNVEDLPGNIRVREFIQKKLDQYIAGRKAHTKEELRKILLDALKIKLPDVPDYRKGQIIVTPELWRFTFGLYTETPGRVMSVLSFPHKAETKEYIIPQEDYLFHIPEQKEYTVYVADRDAHAELAAMKEPWKQNIVGLDIRGCGDCRPLLNGREFFTDRYERYMANFSIMLGRPYLGGKVKDILAAVELLSKNGAKIHLMAKGKSSIPALLATVLSDKIASLKLIDAPDSWAQEITNIVPKLDFQSIIPGILKETDLPELRKAVEDKLQ